MAPEKENKTATKKEETDPTQILTIRCFFLKVMEGNEMELRFEVEFESS